MFKRFAILIFVFLFSCFLSHTAYAMSTNEFLQLCAKGSEAEAKEAIAEFIQSGAGVNVKDQDGVPL